MENNSEAVIASIDSAFSIDDFAAAIRACEDVELMGIDEEELARDRIITNTDSPFLLNFDLDNHHLDVMDVPVV